MSNGDVPPKAAPRRVRSRSSVYAATPNSQIDLLRSGPRIGILRRLTTHMKAVSSEADAIWRMVDLF